MPVVADGVSVKCCGEPGFVVKDSGEREEFSTGSRRDTQDGKGDFSLVPLWPLEQTQGVQFPSLTRNRLEIDMLRCAWEYGELDEKPDTLARCAAAAFWLMELDRQASDGSTLEVPNKRIPYYSLVRIAEQLRKGAVKYGKSNWRRGFPFSRMQSSLRRHASQYGWETTEDHLAAVVFNAFCLMEYGHQIARGELPPELDDLYFHQPAGPQVKTSDKDKA